MRDVVAQLDRWRAAGLRAAVATVAEVRLSAPRPPGAKLVVSSDGAVHGMVSGGCVEGAVVLACEEVLAGGPPRLLHFGIADAEAWAVGLPCGGEIAVWVDRDEGEAAAAFTRWARAGEPGALVTRLDDGRQLAVADPGPAARLAPRAGDAGQHGVGARAATPGDAAEHGAATPGDAAEHGAATPGDAAEHGTATPGDAADHGAATPGDATWAPGVHADRTCGGGLGDAALEARAVALAREAMAAERTGLHEVDGVWLLVDVTVPPPRLIVFGAIDLAAHLCTLARPLGWRSFVCDPRGRFADPARFPDADGVIAAWPDRALAQLGGLGPADAVVVLTHDPKLDDAALVPALRSDASYVGAMGSRRTQAARRERLLGLGLTEDELDRLAGPIGLDLGALTPGETALSVLAEVVALRRGRTGGRLRDALGRIHEVGA